MRSNPDPSLRFITAAAQWAVVGAAVCTQGRALIDIYPEFVKSPLSKECDAIIDALYGPPDDDNDFGITGPAIDAFWGESLQRKPRTSFADEDWLFVNCQKDVLVAATSLMDLTASLPGLRPTTVILEVLGTFALAEPILTDFLDRKGIYKKLYPECFDGVWEKVSALSEMAFAGEVEVSRWEYDLQSSVEDAKKADDRQEVERLIAILEGLGMGDETPDLLKLQA